MKNYLTTTFLNCILVVSLSSQAILDQTVLFEIYGAEDVHVDGDNIYVGQQSYETQFFEEGVWSEPIVLQDEFATSVGITKDDNDVIWFASGDGLVSIANNQIEIFTESNSDLPNDNLIAVHSYRDSLWLIASLNEVILKVGDDYEVFRPFSGSFTPMGPSEITNNGNLIVSTFSDIAVFEGTSISELSFSGRISDMFKSADGDIYIGGSSGPAVYTDNTLVDLEDRYGNIDIVTHGLAPNGDYYALLDSRNLYFQSASGAEFIIEQIEIMEPNFEGFFVYQDTLRSWGANVNSTASTRAVITTLNGVFLDEDNDGFFSDQDCDDSNDAIFPGADEICDGMDNDCDGVMDNGLEFFTVYLDEDGDGYGQEEMSRSVCMIGTNESDMSGDCDDSNPEINPSATEIPSNGIDENCDGMDLVSSTKLLSSQVIRIFPNPVASHFFVDHKNTLDFQVVLYGLGGVRIPLGDSTTEKFDIQNLSDGIYLLEISDKNSRQRIVERIIKTH